MGTLCKIQSEKFDLNKPVVLCGKAKNASVIYDWLNRKNTKKYYTSAINSACTFYDNEYGVDFLFASEIGAVKALKKYDYRYSKVKRLVVQEVAKYHGENGMIVEHPSKTFQDLSNLFPNETKVFTYKVAGQLRTVDLLKDKRDNITFEPGISTYFYALKWLTTVGFKKFIIFGINDQPEYNELFVANRDGDMSKPKQWYEKNFEDGLKVLNESDCSYVINDFDRSLRQKCKVTYSPTIEWLH